MLLTITTTHRPATDLGYLLHKHPQRFQSFDLSFGQAHVFYPEVSEDCTTAAHLLEVDPVGMVRGRGRESVKWETLPAGQFRHADHRFEWTRQKFEEWAGRLARQHGYRVRFVPVGPVDETVGPPTQMGIFERD